MVSISLASVKITAVEEALCGELRQYFYSLVFFKGYKKGNQSEIFIIFTKDRFLSYIGTSMKVFKVYEALCGEFYDIYTIKILQF